MTTPALRAGVLRGGLVGGCSALLAAVAHGSAGGVPHGSAVAMLMVACAAVGAVTAACRSVSWPSLAVGLGAGQAAGHLTLATAHHGGHGLVPSAPMLAAHAAAAVGLALLIGLVGHLYEVCSTLLAWLAPDLVHRGRPRGRTWFARRDVRSSRLLDSALRLRGPPVCG